MAPPGAAGADGPLTIRRVGEGEIALHRRVLDLYARAFEEPETYLERQPSDAWLTNLLARPDFVELAALEEGAVVGALSGYFLPKFEQERSEFYIYDLAVDESRRRRGVATALIEALRPIALAGGAWVIFVQADHGDEPATRLYEKLGVREEVLHFDIEPRGAQA